MQKVDIQYNGSRKTFESRVNFRNCFDEKANPVKQHALPLLYKGVVDGKEIESTVGTVDRLSDNAYVMNLAPIPGQLYENVYTNIETLKLTVKPIEGGNGYLFVLKDN